ncbi:biopolymer transporter ExbD [Rhodoblastus sphagnicola]|uniref:Biopolymer transporter ExbD n=1 Tax=Rhodoblastus sphagnicola TaxID=333368 RepID=A0A2S6MWI5_9HYPH|nr:biopolymer transporter ExbD [Rhodoblastus sphagnicola]MBB4200013.1 biopolymer transport protein ExbD/biopolymer transport protein TolR [Rhodoblastus sphagnicola]PPQ26726.1 biopolymer transporter ExbD [Rhodoblastus sphagnicola]
MLSSPLQNGRPGLFRAQADINVTPLVDVMLVLLIIFMVTAPLLATGVKVDLPQAKAAKPLDPKEPVVVAVDRDGHVALGAEQVDRADLVDRVKLKVGDDLAHVVHIRGDKDAAFGQIVSVMDDLAHNGMTHLAIVTDNSRKGFDAGSASSAEAPKNTAPRNSQ